MASTTILLARHGETADNARLVFQGQTGKGLNARGRAQAARLGERMRQWPADAIFSSDLERAVETANIVELGQPGLLGAGARSGADVTPSARVTLDVDLREVDVGRWSGKSHDEIAALWPEEWEAWSAGLDLRRGGGETYAELAERVDRALRRVVAAHPGQRVLVVSHGGAIKSWVAMLLGVSAAGLRALAGVGNASLTEVEIDDRGRARLHGWNDRSHLEGLVVSETTD